MKKINQDDSEMTDAEMNDILRGMYDNMEYRAIMRYVTLRFALVQESFRSLDPFREPTLIARAQGRGEGLFDLRDYILLLNKKASNREAGE